LPGTAPIIPEFHLFAVAFDHPREIPSLLRKSPVKANVFRSTIYPAVNDFNPPSHRISGDTEISPVVESLDRSTKLFWFPRVNLHLVVFIYSK